MKLIKEHLKILKCFFYEDYSIEEVSDILNISEHKIRRHLNELYLHFQATNIKELKQNLSHDWESILKFSLNINSLDRRNYILLSFLKNDFINLNTVTLTLNTTRRTLNNDLNNIKNFLTTYNLSCNSLNSKGIQLIGKEEDKKNMFFNILFNLFLDKEYLPNIFDLIFSNFNSVIDENIQNIITKIISKKNVIPQSYILLRLELIFFIALIRNPFYLNIYSFKFEIKSILFLCKKYTFKTLFKNSLVELERVDKFIKYLQSHISISDSFSENTYISLISRFNLIEFKNNINLSEFYLINKNFEKKYRFFYYNLMKLIEQYFKHNFNFKIDSFDKIMFFLILKKYLFLKQPTEKENIIVYNIFQLLVLNEIIQDLKEKNIFICEAISIYALKLYLRNNHIKNILIFENINFEEFVNLDTNIKITKLSLPFNEGDYLNIKSNLNL